MGIDGDVQMELVGQAAGGGYQYASLSLPGSSIDKSHEARLLSSPVPLGELLNVELSCRRQGLLATRLQYIEVVRLSDGRHFLFLPPLPDPTDPPDPAAGRLVLRAASQPYFRISTFTSALPEASTDARVYVDLFGCRGKLLDLHLRDSTGDCFNEGAEDVFFFPDPGLGELGSICISHDDSGDSPNWHLDRLEISHTGTGRTDVFVCKQWIGLRAHEQDAGDVAAGRFGEDRVLERVLYPTHVLASLKNGKPLLRYHVMFHCESPAGELAHTAEALQLVGWQTAMDEASRSSPRPRPTHHYQVVLRKLAVFQAHANISISAGPAVRQLALVLHGCLDSCRPIMLGSDNSTTAGVPPFTSTSDDVFQVTCDTPLGERLLRLDVRLPGTAPPDWGVLLQSVTLRDLSDAASEPAVFVAGAGGQWVGASPDSPDGLAGGTQALHLLPEGCCAVSFVGRALQELAALHVRHDTPALHLGWRLNCIQVLVSPPAGAPVREGGDAAAIAEAFGSAPSPATATAATPAAARRQVQRLQQQQRDRAALAVSAVLYNFPGCLEQQQANKLKGAPSCWPSDEAPFIRHYLTDDYLAQPYPPQSYFAPPLIEAPQLPTHVMAEGAEWGWEAEAAGGDDGGLAPIDAAATAALLVNRDPERLQALAGEYQAEVAAYLEHIQEGAAGRGPGTDLFTLMRARIRAEPNALSDAFARLDTDKDGKLSNEEVLELVSWLLPPEVACSPQQSAYAAAMLTLGSVEPMTQPQVVSALKACRSAYKESASMMRMVAEGGVDWFQLAQEDGLGAELALCRLAEQLVQPANAAAAAAAFKQYDTDGSGHLDIRELCQALQSIPDLRLSGREVRLLLAYLFHFGDTDKDLRLSVPELQTSLAPFLPRPPAEELRRALDTYALSRNLPALLRSVIKLQPGTLPAACALAQAKATAAAAAAGLASAGPPPTATTTAAASDALAESEDVVWVPLSLLPDIVAAVVPEVEVPSHEVLQLQQLIALDSGAVGLPLKELVAGIMLSADAIKRAASIARMVSSAAEAQEPLALDRELQSAEVVLQRLADILAEGGGEQIAAAFAALDSDGSGYLDGPELCGAVRQVEALVTKEELRTLLAYVQKYADTDANGRISLGELQVLLRPFQ
ncbi:hypothetical protein PLESTF_000128700 [Pleodorina starrii]|nr:hypothetical protein PLESTF_000128700 [Pleodorina starrii]